MAKNRNSSSTRSTSSIRSAISTARNKAAKPPVKKASGKTTIGGALGEG